MLYKRNFLLLLTALVLASPVLAENPPIMPLNPPQAQQQNPPANQIVTQETTTTTTTAMQVSKINLNKATPKELMKIKGLNSTRAKAIVAYRNKNGDFQSTDELLKVKGFKKLKPAMLKQIQSEVVAE